MAAGVTLTIAPGTTVVAAASDGQGAGVDTGRVELIVNGTLNANGSSGSPITFTSQGSAANAWYGIRVLAGTGTTLSHATINEANRGLDTSVDVSASNLTVTGSSIGFFVTAGTLTLTNSQASSNTSGMQTQAGSTANVSGSIFNSSSNYGLYLQGAGTFHHITSANNGYGVYVYATGGNAITLRDSILSGNTNYELYRSSSSSAAFTWTHTDYWNNGVGSTYNATCSTGCFSSNPSVRIRGQVLTDGGTGGGGGDGGVVVTDGGSEFTLEATPMGCGCSGNGPSNAAVLPFAALAILFLLRRGGGRRRSP